MRVEIRVEMEKTGNLTVEDLLSLERRMLCEVNLDSPMAPFRLNENHKKYLWNLLTEERLDDEDVLYLLKRFSERFDLKKTFFLKLENPEDGEEWNITAKAADCDRWETCKWLLRNLDRPQTTTPFGMGLVTLTLLKNPKEAMNLIEEGVSIFQKDIHGNDALISLCEMEEWEEDHIPLAKTLIEGLGTETFNSMGERPLHKCAWWGNARACSLLVEYGANAEAKTALGLTAIDLAEKGNHTDVADWLAGVALARKEKASISEELDEKNTVFAKLGQKVAALIEKGRLSLDGTVVSSSDDLIGSTGPKRRL